MAVSPAVAVQISDGEVDGETSGREKIKERVTGTGSFEILKPGDAGEVVYASDFGFSEKATATQNAESLQAAIDYCKKKNASVLELECGNYYISRENKTQIVLNGLENFTLQGNGARLVFCETQNTYSNARFIYIANCNMVEIKNLTIDWDWDRFPLFITGKVSAVEGDTVTVTSDRYNIPDGYVSVVHTKGWDYDADNVTANVSWVGKTLKATEKLSDKEIKYTFSGDVTGTEVGDGVQIAFKPRLNADAVSLEENEHLTLYNVEINAAPYVAINSTGDKYLEIDNCRVIPSGERRFSSYGGNEIHAMRGYFKFTNNTTSGILDDNLHLSNHYLGGGLKMVDEYTLTCEYLQQWSAIKYIYTGAVLELRSNEFIPKGWKGTVKDFKWNYNVYDSANAHGCTITFDKPLPWNIDETDYLFNADFYEGEYLIENNTMYGGLCHAMYICLGNGTIRNNTAECFAYPALVLNTVKRWQRWFIGTQVRNVIISDNSFKNINLNKRDPAGLFVGAGVDNQPTDYYPVGYPPVEDVVVINNTIENSGLIAMGAFSARNVLFEGNTIINPNLYENKERFNNYGRMYAVNSRNIHFYDNTVENTVSVYGTEGIGTDGSEEVYISNNHRIPD